MKLANRSTVGGTLTTLSSFDEPQSLIWIVPYLELNLPSHAFEPVLRLPYMLSNCYHGCITYQAMCSNGELPSHPH